MAGQYVVFGGLFLFLQTLLLLVHFHASSHTGCAGGHPPPAAAAAELPAVPPPWKPPRDEVGGAPAALPAEPSSSGPAPLSPPALPVPAEGGPAATLATAAAIEAAVAAAATAAAAAAAAAGAAAAEATAKAVAAAPPKPLPTIFISTASYRDRECAPTVERAFRRAAHPERVFFGIFQQHNCSAGDGAASRPACSATTVTSSFVSCARTCPRETPEPPS